MWNSITGNVQSRRIQRQEKDSWVLGTEEGEMVVHGMGGMVGLGVT